MSKKAFQDTIDWYNQHAQEYAHTLSGRSRFENIDLFLSYLPSKAKILDAGCAGGRDTNVMFEKGYNMTGIDVSEGLIAVAKETYPHIHFVQGNFLHLPFEDKTFDGIWAHASLVHLPSTEDTQLAISEFARVMKSKGIVYIYVKAQIGEEKTALKTDSFSDTPRFFQYYTQNELHKFLTNANFEIITSEVQQDLGKRAGVEWILVLARKK